MSQVYGRFIIHVLDDQTDRIGVRTLVLAQRWQPSRADLSIAERDAEKPPIPAVAGGLLLIGEQVRPAPGGLRSMWTFEGIGGDGKTVTFKDRSNSLDYSFDPAFSQVSIVKHPKWKQFHDEFEGRVYDGEVLFPETLSEAGAGGGIGLGNGKSSEAKTNPMFGHDDYFRVEGTYSFRYLTRSLSAAFRGVGKIHSTGALPGGPPQIEDGRNWLKAPPPFQRRGPVFDVTEIYWMSGEGGWTKEIYGGTGQGSTGSSGIQGSGGIQGSVQGGGAG